MMPPPPNSLPSDLSPSPPPVSVYISWTLILLSVSLIFIVGLTGRRSARGQIAADQLEFEYTTRYVIGLKHFSSASTAAPIPMEKLVAQVRDQARTPIDHLRAIPVIGELQGDQAALESIKEFLDQDPPQDLQHDAHLLQIIYTHGSGAISAKDRQDLIDRYGWWGKLAVTHNAPPDDPLRKEVDWLARRTLLAALTSGGVIVLFLLAGITLLIVFFVQFSKGNLRPLFEPADSRVADRLVEGVAAWLVTFLMMQFVTPLLPQPANVLWNLLLVVPFVAALLWLRERGIIWPQLAAAVGWDRGRGIVREMLIGITGYITGFPLLALAFLLTFALMKISKSTPSHPIQRQLLTHGWPRVMMFLLACVFAPITEEFLFRGLLLGHLRRRHGWIFSAVIVSLIFAAIHPQGWTTIPVLGTIAMILASLREQRRSLIAPMTAHALNNFLVLLIVVLALG